MGVIVNGRYLRTFVLPLWGGICVVPQALAELQSLEDSVMSGISGQTGITLEIGLNATIDQLSYFDDGNGIHLEDFRIASASNPGSGAFHRVAIDIGADASLNLDYLVEDRRIEFGDVRLAGAPGVSMGGMFFDHTLEGFFRLSSGGSLSGAGYTFDTAYTMTGGRLGYRTNGNEVFLDDVTLSVEALGVTMDAIPGGLLFTAPSITGSYNVGAIRYSSNPLNHGNSVDVTTGTDLPSYGSLSGDFDLSGETSIGGGGRSGEGIHIDSQTTINSANFMYVDDGNAFALKGITGNYRFDDLRIDVTTDWQGREALGLTLGALEGGFNVERIELGAAGKSLGSVNMNFLFEDQVVNGVGYTNAIYLQGGGHADAGEQGLRLAAQWSLVPSDFSYTEDGNRVIFSGLQSWGQGDLTVNVTREELISGTEFFDGLRIGFEGIKGGYRINGLRVGDEDAPLQGGTELLLALGFYPAYEFELDGHITLGAGGATGDGITVNSDVVITNGNAALIANPYDEGAGEIVQTGLWVSDLNYDAHLRNMTIDITPDGFAIIKGEAWSTMDIGNLRVGDKADGESFGRFVIQSYETGSTMTITPGGAGAVCAGGTGGDSAACTASGGLWEDRGDEGVTIAMTQILARAVSDTKRNAITWEANRTLDGAGNPLNDTGMKLVLNDIYTSDGGDFDGDGVEDNTFGIQSNISVDVFQTRVVKRDDGADSLGVVGARGDERIMDPTAAEGYRYVSSPTVADIQNRPLGFAVQARAQFRELSINNIDLVHPVGGSQTAIYGVKMQNFDINANLTATPMP
ncbi:DUF6160 family protein [Marinobacter zhejiangensis]|uniref:DUF6160 domain-containing protein n=1 Tax=Marinobacter zhejiangensis TaxID=488535 RepID=A0A1I4TTM7_9GAMM|nr:DUF6160 family protein [Marinobacter zhejiangensis]SFM79935.1 hypothetical protein SAMN04487963_0009 [Marinobacter zhejiangensis]